MMKSLLLLIGGFVFIKCSTLNIHPNSVEEDPLEAEQACGAAGYVLDAPIPEAVSKKRRSRRAATNQKFRVWPSGIIPYVFDKSISKAGQNIIVKSMRHWENETCIKFTKRKYERDFIHITSGKGCCSYVGRKGGKQFVSLGPGCLRFGIVTHELGHVVGFWHEQNRPDRSIYIDIIYDNVDTSKYLNFDPRSNSEIETFDQIYDYSSIMHYGTRFFSKNGRSTIQTKNTKFDDSYELVPGNTKTNEIGKSYYKFEGPVLSKHDVLEANLLYKCSKISECGGTLFASSGSFTSINYPNPYPKDKFKECLWIITTTRNKKYKKIHTSLTLIFDDFNVGEKNDNQQCDGDYVEIREGQGFLSPFIVRYCGNKLPSVITTMTGSLFIRFHISGKDANEAATLQHGFKAGFKTDICSHRITKLPSQIQTPQFPFPYQQGKDCLWSIHALKGMRIIITFKFFLLHEHDNQEGCLDYLDIHEGDGATESFIGRYCSKNNPRKITSNYNKMKLHFHSSKLNQLGWYMGFQADVKEEDINECSETDHKCSQACINYPGGYFCGCYPGYNTVYQLPSRKSECVDKDECAIENGGCSDICINSDGSYTCACPEGYMLNENKTTCIDLDECLLQPSPCSHHCYNTIGSYQCSCYVGYVMTNDGITCVELAGCNITMTSPVGIIDSPTLQPSYRETIDCLWKINIPDYLQLVIDIDLPWLDNQNCTSYLIIYENQKKREYKDEKIKVCLQSDSVERIVMSQHKALIEYHLQYPYKASFKIRYHSINPNLKLCNHKYNVTNGRIHTPGFPVKYPDATDCTWIIYSPNRKLMRLKFGQFDIESHETCDFDYLEVIECYYSSRNIKKIGKFCGHTKPANIYFNGLTSYLKINFVSDATMSEKGVKMLFKETRS